MNMKTTEDLTLFGLLARSWHMDAAVSDIVLDAGGRAAAFVLADGSIALARLEDSEPASKRIRVSVEHGGVSIQPRTNALPPLTHVTAVDGAPAAVAAHGDRGFVFADASGALIGVTAEGEQSAIGAAVDGPVVAIASAARTGQMACAGADGRVTVFGTGEARGHVLPNDVPALDVRYSPRGDILAVAHRNMVTLWNMADDPGKLAEAPVAGRPLALAWSPDGAMLGCGEDAGARIVQTSGAQPVILADYPSSVRSIAWGFDDRAMVTSGAFRIIAWPRDRLAPDGSTPSTVETGRAGLAAVEAVAGHPKKPLVAAGYENGILVIAEIGKPDEMPIKSEGQGAISVIRWTGDGQHVAFGTDRGLAAIVELPRQIFK